MASRNETVSLPLRGPLSLDRMMNDRPWDARLARMMVRPLVDTPVHPNHITTLGLLVGLAAAVSYAQGGRGADWGAFLFALAMLIDHGDGELARLSGKTSASGHTYDRIVDLVVKVGLFVGVGFGLSDGPLGAWAIPMGFLSGLSLAAIFASRGAMAASRGPQVYEQPSFAGFELEDILYLIAPLTWLGGLPGFFSLCGVGIPAFAAFSVFQWWRTRSSQDSSAAG